jgi:hypothetical protein
MQRWFSILSAMSLLLFVVTVIFWLEVDWSGYRSFGNPAKSSVSFGVEGQLIRVLFARRVRAPRLDRVTIKSVGQPVEFLGGQFRSWNNVMTDESGAEQDCGHLAELYVPFTWPLALLAVLPSLWLLSRGRKIARQYYTRRAGCCAVCGYDLRASSGRCPECGAQITSSDPADSARNMLIAVLREAAALLARPQNDFAWSSWEDADQALAEISRHIAALEAGNLPPRLQLTVLFAPTGAIQEVSISSGWGEEFLSLADRFDRAERRAYGVGG